MPEIKHVFLINTNAVINKKNALLKEQIISACKNLSADCEIYDTHQTSDIKRYVTLEIEKNSRYDALRFYACGGDGTLNQVANAVYQKSGTQVAVVPLGTGNDFVKSFTNSACFLDIERQIQGEITEVDAIAYEGGIAVNMINIGFDCMVVAKTAETKKWPFIKGAAAYLAAVAMVLKEMPLSKQKVLLDGQEVPQENFLLNVIANGAYCGGGFNAASKAILNDGYLDVLLVYPLSRRKFLSVVGMYKKGTLLDDTRAEELLRFERCKNIQIIPAKETMYCSDGEIFSAKEVTFSVDAGAICFSAPKGCRLKNKIQ